MTPATPDAPPARPAAGGAPDLQAALVPVLHHWWRTQYPRGAVPTPGHLQQLLGERGVAATVAQVQRQLQAWAARGSLRLVPVAGPPSTLAVVEIAPQFWSRPAYAP